jgi:hypothetical protein
VVISVANIVGGIAEFDIVTRHVDNGQGVWTTPLSRMRLSYDYRFFLCLVDASTQFMPHVESHASGIRNPVYDVIASWVANGTHE